MARRGRKGRGEKRRSRREFSVILKSVFVPRNREGACLQECKSQTQANRAESALTSPRAIAYGRWLRPSVSCRVSFTLSIRPLHSRSATSETISLRDHLSFSFRQINLEFVLESFTLPQLSAYFLHPHRNSIRNKMSLFISPSRGLPR